MRRALATATIAGALALVPATASTAMADDTLAAGPAVTQSEDENSGNNDDSAEYGDYGLIGLLGLFGLFGYKKYKDHRASSTGTDGTSRKV